MGAKHGINNEGILIDCPTHADIEARCHITILPARLADHVCMRVILAGFETSVVAPTGEHYAHGQDKSRVGRVRVRPIQDF